MRGTAPQSPGGTTRAALATGGVDPGPGPREMVEGVGVGFSHDEAGAVAAAVSYTMAPQAWLYRSDEVVRASVEAVTVPAARADLVPGLVEDARLLRDELSEASGDVWFVVAPLATRVESYRDGPGHGAGVGHRVLSADGVAVPQAGWHTETFELAWVGGDWRIAGVEETEGPTPSARGRVAAVGRRLPGPGAERIRAAGDLMTAGIFAFGFPNPFDLVGSVFDGLLGAAHRCSATPSPRR